MLEPLGPTSASLQDDEERPYFLWWTDATVADLRARLRDTDPKVRVYWLGALLRDANSRDVWLYTTPAEILRHWPLVARHLGRTRRMWAWLLGVADAPPSRGG
jgi:hypothetical protein